MDFNYNQPLALPLYGNTVWAGAILDIRASCLDLGSEPS